MQVPVDAIKLAQPLANWPPHIDWMQTLGGVLSIGLDLQREPLDVFFPPALAGRPLTSLGLSIKKGFKRLSAAMFVLMHAMKFDPEDSKLELVMDVLLRLRSIPVMYTAKESFEGHTFDYIMLSNRQSLRQRLNPLQLAFLMESMVLERSEKSQEYKAKTNKDKLFAIVEEFNKQPGVRDMRGWQIQPDERWALCNLSIGCCDEAKTLLRLHLNHFKWADCAVTRDHLRSTSWLVGYCGANSIAPAIWKELLVVTVESQVLFLERYFESFSQSVAKKHNASKKSRVSSRWSVDEFNMQALIAALYLALQSKFFLDAALEPDFKKSLCKEKLRMFKEGCALHVYLSREGCNFVGWRSQGAPVLSIIPRDIRTNVLLLPLTSKTSRTSQTQRQGL